MKAPAFQLYPQDFISSLDVQLMSAAEVGAYCLLLFNSWTQPRQGFLPNDEAQLRHLSRLSPEEWKTSKKKLLAKFPATDDKKHRYNPRLLVEAEKQAAFREKQTEHGKRGGRPRQDEKPDKANPFLGESQNNPTLSQPLGKPNPACAHSSSSSSIPSNDGSAGESSLPAEDLKATLSNDLTARLAALTDTSGEILWSESILNKQDYFAKTARKLITAPDVDLEHYRRAMLIAAEAGNLSRDIKGWESWVSIFLTNQLQRGPLLTMVAAAIDLTKPTPKHLLPPEGSDCTGRHIVLSNTGDASLNQMFAANYKRDYPNAIIHTTR